MRAVRKDALRLLRPVSTSATVAVFSGEKNVWKSNTVFSVFVPTWALVLTQMFLGTFLAQHPGDHHHLKAGRERTRPSHAAPRSLVCRVVVVWWRWQSSGKVRLDDK